MLGEARRVERAADGADAAVHHVRGRDHVGAGPRVHDGHARQQLERGVVEDLLALDHAAVAVRRVLAQADVGDDEQLAALGADGAHRPLHDAVVRVALRALRVLALGQAEQDDARDAERLDLPRLARGLVDREVEAARAASAISRRTPSPGDDEQGIDQAVGGEAGLAHHAAEALGAAQAAGTLGGEGHGRAATVDAHRHRRRRRTHRRTSARRRSDRSLDGRSCHRPT